MRIRLLKQVPGWPYPGTETNTATRTAAKFIAYGWAEAVGATGHAFDAIVDEIRLRIRPETKKKKRAKNEKNTNGAGAGRKPGKRGKRSNG